MNDQFARVAKPATAAAATVCLGAAMGLAGCAASEPSVYDIITATPENIATTAPDPWQSMGQETRDHAEEPLADGTYTGIGHGMEGIITVTLDVKDDHITCVTMTQDGETPGMSGFEAIRDGVFAQLIDAAQGADIDTVSGATITTLGVQEAVEDALSQARM